MSEAERQSKAFRGTIQGPPVFATKEEEREYLTFRLAQALRIFGVSVPTPRRRRVAESSNLWNAKVTGDSMRALRGILLRLTSVQFALAPEVELAPHLRTCHQPPLSQIRRMRLIDAHATSVTFARRLGGIAALVHHCCVGLYAWTLRDPQTRLKGSAGYGLWASRRDLYDRGHWSTQSELAGNAGGDALFGFSGRQTIGGSYPRLIFSGSAAFSVYPVKLPLLQLGVNLVYSQTRWASRRASANVVLSVHIFERSSSIGSQLVRAPKYRHHIPALRDDISSVSSSTGRPLLVVVLTIITTPCRSNHPPRPWASPSPKKRASTKPARTPSHPRSIFHLSTRSPPLG
ncbi:hypothetical protein B0H10DRAFT_1941898 [Mycena sp. CBHHK59/15]|nr:hypothetical protein B0H10DRAFT_1941898 [Mycena sp. CBHHK59/15]